MHYLNAARWCMILQVGLFSAEGQLVDISMMEILNTWLDALLDIMCMYSKVLHAKKNIYKCKLIRK